MGRYTVRAFQLVALLGAVALPDISLAQSRLQDFVREVISRAEGRCATETAFALAREHHSKGERILDATPQLQDSILSPSGHFKVFYDHTGPNVATNEYAEYVAATADTAYMLEIDTLGYPKPPYSFGDSTFHIYILALGSAYGFTAGTDGGILGSTPSGLTRSRSFIVMDHAFTDDKYPTKGLDAARITVFHEFHHVIQFGSYGNGTTPGDVNFREMTSTFMEMRSSPWIHDYDQYVGAYLPNLNKAFTLADPDGGYGQCIWMNYVSKTIADSVVREFWQYYSNVRSNYLIAFDSVLGSHSRSFCEVYRSFGLDLFSLQRTYFASESLPISRSSLELLPVTYYQNDTSLVQDPASLVFAISQSTPAPKALISARNTDYSTITVLNISPGSAEGWSSDHPEKFCAGVVEIRRVSLDVFPQPFVLQPTSTQTLSILASTGTSKPVSAVLNIYSTNQALVRHADETPELNGGNWYASWDGFDDIGRPVSSGIYYYTLLTDGNHTQGKIAVVRK